MRRAAARGARALPAGAHTALLLAPALIVTAVFFVGGLGEAAAQSLGYQSFVGESHPGLSAYRAMATDPAVRAGLGLTVQVALVSTLVSAVLGVALALLVRRLSGGRRWAARLTQANLAVPHLVGALALTLLLAQTGLLARAAYALGLISTPNDFPALTADGHGLGIMAEYVWKETPFLAVLALGALGGGIEQLERAGRVLGARPWQRLRHITLPAVLPPVAAGSVLVLAFTVGSYEVPYLLGRPYPAALPVVAYQYYTDIDLTRRPEAMAIAVLITAFTVLALVGYLAVLARTARRRL